ncbi:uncharacterized protein LOC133195143 [Saccostrea echinata]|uniref:uncharacterized protein LOC133195143 n=1 Tax=Saccostrea echinata TaxID=191078 RepID=UPI002A7F1233|nr:uncharacterized protein LOC133195143 [Saccostrea echinata]
MERCYCKKKIKTKRQNQKARKEKSEGSRATGLMNYAYFTIELQDQVIKSSSLDNKIESPYTEAKEEIYDHIRDKQSRKNTDDVEYKYDTTKNAIAKKEQNNQSTEETYDRLGEERCNTNADDTYHHALTIIKERSEYDVTDVRKQYILGSPYNHVEIIPNENDTEQDTISSLSEKMNEDHTYFILEQD